MSFFTDLANADGNEPRQMPSNPQDAQKPVPSVPQPAQV